MFDPRIYLLSERLSGNVLMGKVSDEEFIKALCKCDVYSIDYQGAQVGGAILNGDRFHLTVLPDYQGKVGFQILKAIEWAHQRCIPFKARVHKDNTQVIRLVHFYRHILITEDDVTLTFEIYPREQK